MPVLWRCEQDQLGGLLLLREVGGGLLFGLALGYGTFRLLRSVDNYQLEVLLTFASVIGGYALANPIKVSGPLRWLSRA